MRDGFGRGFGVGLLLIAGAVLGQTGVGTPPQAAANKLAFVSATVKPSVRSNLTSQGTTFDIQTGNIEQIKNNYGFPQSVRFGVSQLQYGNMPFIDLIAMAYNVKLDQISGPGWMNDVLFDVEATLPPGASKDEISAMLQNLLQDRFKLVIHRVTKNQPVLALVVAKGGPKLQPATANPQPILTNKWGDSTVRSNNMSRVGRPVEQPVSGCRRAARPVAGSGGSDRTDGAVSGVFHHFKVLCNCSGTNAGHVCVLSRWWTYL